MMNSVMNKMNPKTPEIIKRKREERGWTQSHFAEIAGLSSRTIQRLEKGEGASKETLLAVASVLEVDVKTLTDENVSQIPKPDSKIVLLPKLENGKETLDVVWGADAFEMDHPHVTGEEGSVVGALLENLKDMGEIGPECSLGRKIEWAEDIDTLLCELIELGFIVFGQTRRTTLSTNDGKKIKFNVATVIVAKKDNPAIVREEGQVLLTLLMPNKREVSF